mmetsp:Transcript_64907/g.97843  ORF Transcript_64907/g.97843 Transcript_64907/m.97843 type:complete len:325 (+) Transcript_64907:808-1782(+)
MANAANKRTSNAAPPAAPARTNTASESLPRTSWTAGVGSSPSAVGVVASGLGSSKVSTSTAETSVTVIPLFSSSSSSFSTTFVVAAVDSRWLTTTVVGTSMKAASSARRCAPAPLARLTISPRMTAESSTPRACATARLYAPRCALNCATVIDSVALNLTFALQRAPPGHPAGESSERVAHVQPANSYPNPAQSPGFRHCAYHLFCSEQTRPSAQHRLAKHPLHSPYELHSLPLAPNSDTGAGVISTTCSSAAVGVTSTSSSPVGVVVNSSSSSTVGVVATSSSSTTVAVVVASSSSSSVGVVVATSSSSAIGVVVTSSSSSVA